MQTKTGQNPFARTIARHLRPCSPRTGSHVRSSTLHPVRACAQPHLELLVASPEIKELIQNRAHMEEIRRAAVNEGMRTLKQDGIRKVFEGLTDFTQVRRVCIV